MTETVDGRVIWPEPKHLPTPMGSQMNPDRISFLVNAIRQELVLGEQCQLVDDLDVVEYMVGSEDDHVAAAAADMEQSFRDMAKQGGAMITPEGCVEIADTLAAVLARLRYLQIVNASQRAKLDASGETDEG